MAENPTIRVAAVQMDPKLGDVAGNRATILRHLRSAAGDGARLVVFPECALTGYCFDSREEALACAEPIPTGPSVEALVAACRETGVHTIVGLVERDGDRLFNACVLVGPEGVAGSYRKVHLPFLGVDRFADPGDRPFAVHEAGGLRVGMHICYDGSFPESSRVLSLLGADLLVLPTNWPPAAIHQAQHLMFCRAMENHVYAMAVNRVGTERGFRFIGLSAIVAPGGECLASAGQEDEAVLFAEIDPTVAREKHLVRVPGLHEIDRFADRRPAFYRRIVEGSEPE